MFCAAETSLFALFVPRSVSFGSYSADVFNFKENISLPLPRIEPRFPENLARILLNVIPCHDILHGHTCICFWTRGLDV